MAPAPGTSPPRSVRRGASLGQVCLPAARHRAVACPHHVPNRRAVAVRQRHLQVSPRPGSPKPLVASAAATSPRVLNFLFSVGTSLTDSPSHPGGTAAAGSCWGQRLSARGPRRPSHGRLSLLACRARVADSGRVRHRPGTFPAARATASPTQTQSTALLPPFPLPFSHADTAPI
ncbi:hypothetical protein SEVIR_4G022301v4 [Setaria viridis]